MQCAKATLLVSCHHLQRAMSNLIHVYQQFFCRNDTLSVVYSYSDSKMHLKTINFYIYVKINSFCFF